MGALMKVPRRCLRDRGYGSIGNQVSAAPGRASYIFSLNGQDSF